MTIQNDFLRDEVVRKAVEFHKNWRGSLTNENAKGLLQAVNNYLATQQKSEIEPIIIPEGTSAEGVLLNKVEEIRVAFNELIGVVNKMRKEV